MTKKAQSNPVAQPEAAIAEARSIVPSTPLGVPEVAAVHKQMREDLSFVGTKALDEIERLLDTPIMGNRPLSDDEILNLGHRIAGLKRVSAAMSKLWEVAMIVHLKRKSGGEMSDGRTRYYLGIEKKYKPRDFRAMVGIVLEAAGGDIDRLIDVLSSNAFKHGACKELLGPELFDQAFELAEQDELKEGKPAKTLQKVPLYIAGKKPAKKPAQQAGD